MTIKEAWLEIAKRFEEHIPPRGLCREIDLLHKEKTITDWQQLAIHNSLERYIHKNHPRSYGGYLFPVRKHSSFLEEYDLKRAEIARKLAETTN